MDDHTTPMQVVVESEIFQEYPIIFLHYLASISTPQTLKLRGYIKHLKVVVLVDIGSTQNFIHRRVIKETHCYVHPVSSFQIMIANGGMIPCGGCYENVRFKLGDYHLKDHMFSLYMGGCDIVLRGKWLCKLAPITMDFKKLYLSFTQNLILTCSKDFKKAHQKS